jgi:hypothetical protein
LIAEGLAMKNSSDHDPASFILVVSILGALAGVIGAYGLDSGRLLALLAAVFAVALIVAFRNFLRRISPSLRLGRSGSKVPSYLWLRSASPRSSAVLRDTTSASWGRSCQALSLDLPPGRLAAVSMAMLMVFHFHAHPESGVEF